MIDFNSLSSRQREVLLSSLNSRLSHLSVLLNDFHRICNKDLYNVQFESLFLDVQAERAVIRSLFPAPEGKVPYIHPYSGYYLRGR